ncbi:MAG TPA: VOC family protein [Blastocatellia bacterium]|nr:VOC family protein [Blastocatellia bacterium]
MPEVSGHAPGSFCWFELGTSDQEAAKKFYSALFGWDPQDTQAGPGMIYTLLKLNGKDVAALYQLTEQYHKGVPPHWLNYVAVSDADEAAAKVKSLGGNVLLEPFEVMDLGRMAMFQDPQGATLAIWQAKLHSGSGIVGELNTQCWSELATSDTDKALEFYTKLFGWTVKTGDSSGMVYYEWSNQGNPIGGMYKLTPEMAGVPPHWLPYFRVADCDGIANKAKSLGGNLIVPPTDIPNVGRFSYIQDPQSAAFAIIHLTAVH